MRIPLYISYYEMFIYILFDLVDRHELNEDRSYLNEQECNVI